MKKALLLIAVLLNSILIFAQGNKIQIINANSLELTEIKGSKVKKLVGAVVLKQDQTTLSCDSAYVFDATNFVEAYRNVKINHHDSVFFTGDILKYDGNTKIAKLLNNVVMYDATSNLKTSELEFDLANNKASYYTGGRLVNGTNVLTSKNGYYYTSLKELFFKGNVILIGDEFNMKCDTLKYKTTTKEAYFLGKTVIESSGDSVYAKEGTYNTEKQQGVLLKRAIVKSEQYNLTADTIRYDRKQRYSKAIGKVIAIDTLNKTTVYGGFAEFFGNKGKTYVTANPQILSIMDNDTLSIKADTIYTIKSTTKMKQEILMAWRHVRIYKSDLQAIADSLVYLKNDSLMTLYKKPMLWSGLNQISGDTIHFYINNRKLDSMLVVNNAFVISKETSKHFNQVKGKNVNGYFKAGKINFIQVFGNGQSIYYAKEDSQYLGVNVINCSEMTFGFSEGKLQLGKFITSPEAVFYPIDKLKPEELRLKGFKWELGKRPKRELHL